MSNIIKDAVTLFLITLISGFALGAVHEITLEPIAQAKIAAASETYREVYPDADSFGYDDALSAAVKSAEADISAKFEKVSVDDALVAKDASGNVIGYVIMATSGEGYNGDVQISVGITNDGTITGLGFLSISETPGLGMKATEPEFRSQFPGMTASEDIEINGISGASHTSGAVTSALRAASYFVANCIG